MTVSGLHIIYIVTFPKNFRVYFKNFTNLLHLNERFCRYVHKEFHLNYQMAIELKLALSKNFKDSDKNIYYSYN